MKKHLIPILIFIALASLGAAFYYYARSREIAVNPGQAAQDDIRALVAKVSKLIVLPDETPTVATVTDPDKLKNQPFFANAKKGDRVLIYAAARKAILYDPVENKIVEVAPVDIGASNSPNAAFTAPSAPAK